MLVPGGGRAVVDAVLAYKYPARAMYDNRRQLVFGGSQDTSDEAHAVIHMPDAPMVPKTVLINPALEMLSDELEDGWEGCLSGPGLRGVNRIAERSVVQTGPGKATTVSFHLKVT